MDGEKNGPSPAVSSTLDASARFAPAFEAVWPEAKALPASQLAPVNIDIRAAYLTVVGALPRITAFAEEARALRGFDVTVFHRIETYARAALHAHLVYQATPSSRSRGPSSVADARQRAFTLFVRSYDQIRRALSYLRWDEGDVDQIAPSLWAGRGGSRRKDARSTGASGLGR